MPSIYLKLLGGPMLLAHGEPATGRIAQRHRVALLALLAAHEGITRDKLLGYLWPESTMERARNSLNESLYVVRKALGESAIVSSGDTLALDHDAIQVDLWDFHAARLRGDHERALSLYRAAFMDGFFLDGAEELQEWLGSRRRELEARYEDSLRKAVGAAGARDDADTMLALARRWTALAPTDANATLALTEALARTGSGTAAGRIRDGAVGPKWRGVAVVATVAIALAAAGALVFSRTSHTSPHPRYSTLAVLPFETDSGEAQQYLSIGIPDAIITRLSEHRDLRVRPTSSTLGAGAAADLRATGRALDAEYLITGKVMRLRDAIEVRAQLVNAGEAAVLWGHTYRMPVAQLVALPDSIAADLSRALPLGPPAARSAESRGVVPSTGAYERYLRGRALLAQHRDAPLRQAALLFDSALTEAPDFAPAYAGLAIASAEIHLRFASRAEAATWGDRAVRNARHALQLDSGLAEVHQALAAVARKSEFDWDGTVRESRRAIELNPGGATPYYYMAGAFYHLGRLEDGRAAVRAGQAAQPGGDRVEALRTLGTIELASGNYGEAISLLQDVQRHSDQPVADPHLAAAYFYNGDLARSRSLLEALIAMAPAGSSGASRGEALLASILAAQGKRDSALTMIREATRGTVDHHVAYSIGATYAQLGQSDLAFKWLQTAVDTGFETWPWYERDPLLAPVRADPRFTVMLASMRRR